MALNLVEAAKLMQNPLQAAIVMTFAEQSPVLSALPFINIQGNAYKYNREGTLPSVAFRGVNEAYSESVGVLNPQIEPLLICGGDLDVDNYIIKTQGEQARAVHEAMKVKAITSSWQTKFIKGDSSSDPREIDGLQRRLTGNQVISNNSGSGGGALSLAKLDELIDAVSMPTHLIMNKALRRRLTAASRLSTVGGFITYTQDAFGRKVEVYGDLPILVLEELDGGDTVIPFTEACSGGGASAASSIYCVSFREDHLAGIQNSDMDVRDLGELDTKPVFRTRVEWLAGIAMFHGRGAARLRDITNAAVVV